MSFRPSVCLTQRPPGSWILAPDSSPLNFPLRPENPRHYLTFAGEPLAEIRGFTVKPFEPDAGNAAEGSEVVLRC